MKYPVVDLSNFFSFDLNKLPDNTCIQVDDDESSGKGKTVYYKQLSQWERGIFTIFKILTFDDSQSKNFLFSNPDYESVDIGYVRILVNELVKLYGYDNIGQGYFTKQDEEEILIEESWIGRDWSDTDKWKGSDAVSFNLDDEDGYSLTVWKAIL